MASANQAVLSNPADLSLWVAEVKQLIEGSDLHAAQALVSAFGLCHPTEVWPHILKAWLAVETGSPRTAKAETDIALESHHYPRLSAVEKQFIQALRLRSEEGISAKEFTPVDKPSTEPASIADVPSTAGDVYDKGILPRRPITVKKLAFYLPQFHPIPENDEWWGEGFTEWTNVSRAKPFFPGHWQPRRPGPMGFYDLRVPATMNKQFELARRYGIDGFCFYYYWFNGKKLLEKPLEMLMDGQTDPFPFCICWVNETWTRSWDGMSGEVLVEANQSLEGTKAFIRDLEPALKNENYIRVDGRPLLLIYCAQKLESPEETVQDWREFARTSGIGELHVCAVQSFGFDDPTPWGFDAAVEFPPHCVPHKHQGLTYCRELSEEERQQLGVDPSFSGEIRDYQFYSQCGSIRPKEPYLLYKGCMLAWDNTARRMETAHIYANFSVKAYQDWLISCIDYCSRDDLNPYSESFVFINAWNEWAEGCTLEPDQHFGYALLNATLEASQQAKWIEPFTSYKNGLPMGGIGQRGQHNIVVFGHDAHMHGAQINLLSMVRNLTKKMGNKVYVVLLNGGELVDAYKKLAPTTVLSEGFSKDQAQLSALLQELRARGYGHAILNTIVTGLHTKFLKDNGFKVSNLIHELPSLIRSYQLEENLYEIASHSDDIVFSTNYVRDKIKKEFKLALSYSRVLPQGINFNESYQNKHTVRRELRTKLGFGNDDLVVMACGFADFRKGIDVFIRVAQNIISQIGQARFVWVGRLDPSIESYIRSDITNMGLEERIIITGNLPLPFEHYLSSDIFLLTSREDPLPSVVMEAFDAGLPVIGFEGAGGFVELLDNEERGLLVPYMNERLMSEAILYIKRRLDDGLAFEDNHKFARSNFDYVFYLENLLNYSHSFSAKPLSVTGNPITVSAIIPNYNYKRYLGGRLSSVLAQTKAVDEIIFLDDCSRDGSLDYATSILIDADIAVKILANEANTGSVAAQWKKGIDSASYQYVWLAEADDYCEPILVQELASAASLNSALNLSIIYCQSYMSDALGRVGSTYFDYFAGIAGIDGQIFKSDFVLGGNDFILNLLGVTNVIPNSSACLLSREKLIDIDWPELLSYRYSADWITYIRLAQLGTIAFHSRPLNYHRRHDKSVINRNLSRPKSIYQEAQQIHKLVYSLSGDPDKLSALELACRQWLRASFSSEISAS
ncbi:glycoside hydrolase family 99-like domain-containing protein [Cyanobium sp. ATX 6F1]|nr:glycoside hydrolase family 99-like domain-containing protein [Cyanobium sp. ATX 6F1]